MDCLLAVISHVVLFAIAGSEAQFLFVPQFTLQVDNTGGFKAFLPDPCGTVDKVKFDWRRSGVDAWTGGFLPPPLVPGLWVYDAPDAGLALGDPIFYRTILYQQDGQVHQTPETPFTVTELVETFDPPNPPPPAKICENKTSTTTEEPTKPTEEEEEEEDTTEEEESATKGEDRSGGSTEKPKKKEKPKKEEKPAGKPPKEFEEEWGPAAPSLPPPFGLPGPSPPGPCNSPWLLEPALGDTREVLLEKEVTRMRCEMDRFSLFTSRMYQELNDLKKLNYAMVARMQRLESILRAAPVSAPFSPPFQSPWLG